VGGEEEMEDEEDDEKNGRRKFERHTRNGERTPDGEALLDVNGGGVEGGRGGQSRNIVVREAIGVCVAFAAPLAIRPVDGEGRPTRSTSLATRRRNQQREKEEDP